MENTYKITAAMVNFLDLHRFTEKEKSDYGYIADKIHNYAENIEIEFSQEEAESIAKQYHQIKK